MYDAIVIGARCAGASTAMLLARKGHRVLLVDRATFPSDLPHGHFIHRLGPRRLHRWGLLDRIVATNCPPVTAMSTDEGDFPLAARDLAVDGVPLGIAPRRSALDAVLVDAAVEAGVELRTAFTVDEPTRDGDRVTGIRGHARDGGPCTERATVVIGADGRRSRLAQAVGASDYEASGAETGWYWSYWGELPADGLEMFVRGDRVVMVFPTNDGLTAVFVGWAASALAPVRGDVERAFLETIDAIPSLGTRLRAGRRAERFYGALDLPNFLRTPHGPGWALVGDAGCHKDPFLALGICDALRDSELLADAIHGALAGDAPVPSALAEYARQRDATTLPEYRQNLARARFTPLTPEVMALRSVLRDDAEATRRFFLAYQGMIPREDFFAPEKMQALMARHGASRAAASPIGSAPGARA